MPVEYELKFVLSDPDGHLRHNLAQVADSFEIEQIYTPKGARLRRLREIPFEEISYTFTFKESINGKLLEFEDSVDAQDYELARSGAASELFKIRYKIPVDGGDWDVDFLMTGRPEEGGQVYFVMAELELPEGAPWELLDILKPYLVLQVPYEDSTYFTNRKLCDVGYAREVTERYLAGDLRRAA
jgi:CYTH domain-containing protein